MPRRQTKKGHQDTNRAGTQEDIEETQEARREPPHDVETGDNVAVQEDAEAEPTLPYRVESVNNGKVNSVEEIQHPPHEDEQEIESDTYSGLSALFQDRVERGITVNVLVPAETAGTFLEENSTMIHAICYSTRCVEIKIEVNIGAEHRKFTMLVPDVDIVHKAKNKVIWST